jgi:hypothetical protein
VTEPAPRTEEFAAVLPGEHPNCSYIAPMFPSGDRFCNKCGWVDGGATVEVAAYVVSRIPDTTIEHSTWSVRVEAAGHGRWAVRNLGRCLNKSGEWEYEPSPSNREDGWLTTVRWDTAGAAVDAAVAAEPFIRWNGLTPNDVLARLTPSEDTP